MNILDKKSRQLSKLLRHDPLPLKMDIRGCIKTVDLCDYLKITMAELEWIVDNNDKKRFTFTVNKSYIRAAQGHSVGIAPDKEYARITALEVELLLYHGTDDVTAEMIKKTFIIPGTREYVHWSSDIHVAVKRARQKAYHSKTSPVIVTLRARSYIHGGGKLLMSENEVYLTSSIKGNILDYEEI